MSVTLTVCQNNLPIYDIRLEQDFSCLEEDLHRMSLSGRRVCVVTDSNVAPYYLKKVQQILEKMTTICIAHIIPAGEENKNLFQIQKIYEKLIRHHFDRKDLLIALGGGVVGDMTGFAAATYLRGIDYIQVPTTLLSMVDSSIGGKTGVDFDSYKNMIGAFKMPRLVYMNLATLHTMEEKAYLSGMGEVIKHGLIANTRYLSWIFEHSDEIRRRNFTVLEEMIRESCLIKKEIVEKDPTEQGDRALLNFGHSLGHAIEKEKDFTMYHGCCVSLGCVIASYLSYERGYLSFEELEYICKIFQAFGLPVETREELPEHLLLHMKNDKKMEAGILKFVLLDRMGHAYVDRTVSEGEILRALHYLNRKE